MFGVNWNDPQTLWLNVINLSLGIVTLVCFIVIGYGLFQDVRERSRKRAGARALNRETGALVSGLGDHAFDMPGLGMTLADGGEPLEKPAKSSPKTSRKTGK